MTQFESMCTVLKKFEAIFPNFLKTHSKPFSVFVLYRCLLSRDFVRLGKWFVQPYDGDEDDVGKR